MALESGHNASTTGLDAQVESRLLEVLQSRTSDVTARGMLHHAAKRAATPGGAVDLGAVLEFLESGIETFVEPEARDGLRDALRALREPVSIQGGPRVIACEHDALQIRIHARAVCAEAGARPLTALNAATAATELARNILLYAGAGTLDIQIAQEPSPRVKLVARDAGPGIADVDAALASAEAGGGKALASLRDLADAFDIDTGPKGTTVTFELDL